MRFDGSMPTFTGIDHLAITVSDLAVSVPFYERMLGIPKSADLAGEGLMRAKFALPGGASIGLTQHGSGTDGSFSPFTPGLDHVGFGVATREELEAWAARLTGEGIAHSGLVDAPYGTALSVKDPDGIALEFFASR